MIKEEDLVVVIENGVLKKGKVKYIANRSIAIVWFFEDKQLKKVPIENIALDSQEEEKKKTPVEKESITITPDEFIEISADVVREIVQAIGIDIIDIGAILMSKLCEKLFEKENTEAK